MEHVITTTAKVFWFGRSQAVRLPKEYRLETDEVRSRRHGNAIILDPVHDDRRWLDQIVGPVDADFEAAATNQPLMQERPMLDLMK
ncbi:MAG TPA: AbrB/MazE/SpoVT family DNA-binding domain-containing protein [Rhodopila sp.]|nr:AbrB/MazE/SpoVT family DNA-binding domain-containing protein [Rhodopila sp.]